MIPRSRRWALFRRASMGAELVGQMIGDEHGVGEIRGPVLGIVVMANSFAERIGKTPGSYRVPAVPKLRRPMMPILCSPSKLTVIRLAISLSPTSETKGRLPGECQAVRPIGRCDCPTVVG